MKFGSRVAATVLPCLIALLGGILLAADEVSWSWLVAYTICCGFVIGAFNSAFTARKKALVIALLLACLAGTVVVAVQGWQQATPAREAAIAARKAEAQAAAVRKQHYQDVVADLTRQSFIPTPFQEAVDSNKRQLQSVEPRAVQITLYHNPTDQTVTLNVHWQDDRWVVVCPLANGGWLATYERNNWLAAQLAQAGTCPPGIL